VWIVASVGKYHKPNRVYSRHRKKELARESAIKISKKLGYRKVIGIFEITKDRYYGLYESYSNGKKR